MNAQELNCLTNADIYSATPQAPGKCPLSEISDITRSNLPDIKIKINFHFIKSKYGTGGFKPLGNGAYNDGLAYASNVLNHANGTLNNFVPSPLSTAHVIGDGKIEFQLYSDPNNSSDTYDGVWFWDSKPTTYPYGENVINVVFEDGDCRGIICNLAGFVRCTTLLCSEISLNGAWWNMFNKFEDNSKDKRTFFGHWGFANIMGHEMFHILGLCHSFYINNECKGKDIDPEKECVKTTGSQNCGFGEECSNWGSGSKNIMGFNADQNAITPCQWGIIYNNLINIQPPWSCVCINDNDFITILPGQNVLWDDFRIITKPVRVMPGAILTITCEARFATSAYVEVRRGAQLNVDGALLTNLCKNDFWPGIQVWGNPNAAQTSISNTSPSASQNGIVRIINGSKISHARTAVSTSAWAQGGAAAWSNFGGLVYAANSTFTDNKRAFEFLSYKMRNNSYILNCDISETGNYVGNSVGVTIWECNNILFERNKFHHLDLYGISGVDYGAIIQDHNQFEYLPQGIESYNTLYFTDILKIGNLSRTANYFKNNTNHIVCNSTSGLDRVEIINNNLFDTKQNGIAVGIDGRSYFRIFSNVFQNNQRVGSAVINSGDDANLIDCNKYNFIPEGIRFEGKSDQTQFLDNCFGGNVNTAVSMRKDANFNLAEIRAEQGSQGDPADNCFQNSGVDISAPASSTVNFNYFERLVPTLSRCDQQDINCMNPEGSLSDGGTNNYNEIKISFNMAPSCNTDILNPIPPPVIPCFPGLVMSNQFNWNSDGALPTLRAAETTLRNILIANPSDGDARGCLVLMKDYRLNLLRNLIKQNQTDGNIGLALNYLQASYDVSERNLKFQVQVALQNYPQAMQTLIQNPSNNVDYNQFLFIQQININRLQQQFNYVLSESDQVTLSSIAESPSVYRGYAKALLVLLKDYSYGLTISNDDSQAINTRNKSNELTEIEFKIYPSPVDEALNIEMNPISTMAIKYNISDLTGHQVSTGNFNSAKIISIPTVHIKNGIYYLEINDPNGMKIYGQKISIIHK